MADRGHSEEINGRLGISAKRAPEPAEEIDGRAEEINGRLDGLEEIDGRRGPFGTDKWPIGDCDQTNTPACGRDKMAAWKR